MSPNTSKIALMIDADNIPSKAFSSILTKARSRGKIMSIFASGKEDSLSTWVNVVEEHRLRIITAFVGKDVADRIIAKECAEVSLERPDIDTFCLVSNDKHFAPIGHLLRTWGNKVIVIGNNHAAKVLKDFDFIALDSLEETSPVTISPKTQELMNLLEAAFVNIRKDKSNWVNLSQLKTQLQQENAGFQSKDYGHAKFLKILEALPASFIELKREGLTYSVRLKNQ